jgi:hypothetical protein
LEETTVDLEGDEEERVDQLVCAGLVDRLESEPQFSFLRKVNTELRTKTLSKFEEYFSNTVFESDEEIETLYQKVFKPNLGIFLSIRIFNLINESICQSETLRIDEEEGQSEESS